MVPFPRLGVDGTVLGTCERACAHLFKKFREKVQKLQLQISNNNNNDDDSDSTTTWPFWLIGLLIVFIVGFFGRVLVGQAQM